MTSVQRRRVKSLPIKLEGDTPQFTPPPPKKQLALPLPPPVLSRVKKSGAQSAPTGGSSPYNRRKEFVKQARSLPLKLVGATPRFTPLPPPQPTPMLLDYIKKGGAQSVPVGSPFKRRKDFLENVRSLPITLKGDTPQFKQPPIDYLFWQNYTTGMDIHNYVAKQIDKMHLTLSAEMPPKGQVCKAAAIKLFIYQLVQTILGSPYSPLNRLLIVASTGTGKTCTLVGIANHHVKLGLKHGIVFVAATHALFTNFVQQAMNCPGYMKFLAESMGLSKDNPKDVETFKTHIKKFIYPLNYTEFGNMISGKFKKYEGMPSLENKLILMDEVHYLVDSISPTTFKPDYERVPPAWRPNLKMMFQTLSTRNNPYLKGAKIVGATATPITTSVMEYFSLVNLFAHRPISNEALKNILKNVYKLEQGEKFGPAEEKRLKTLMMMIEPVIKESVSMYIAKTSSSVLDTSVFPDMIFKTINVPMAESQAEIVYKHI